MFNLITGKQKEFNLILAPSGSGKTALAYLLTKKYFLPSLIIDSCEQFNGDSMTFNEFLEKSTNAEFLKDFYTNKRQYVIKSETKESAFLFKTLMSAKRFKNMLVFVDEIDLYIGADRVANSHPFYEFINRGRHKEFNAIFTARATANIPKTLIGQTDFFYIGDLIEKGALKFIDETFKKLNILPIVESLESYQFLKVHAKTKRVQRFHTKVEWLDLFSGQTQNKIKGVTNG